MPAVSNAVDARFAADLAGRYVVEREIGRGASAVVYLARDRKIGRLVALKVLAPGTRDAARRFEREIELVGRLQHPHILALYDSGEAGGSLYFAMPYVKGATLRERLAQEGALPPADALRIVTELADALAYAHASGVVHRDIKPENVLLSGFSRRAAPDSPSSAQWHTLVCDFGIARWAESDADTAPIDRTAEGRAVMRMTQVGHAVGTPAYMAPEQLTGDPSVDRRADLWSLGVVLYEMITGAAPHADAPTAAEAFRRRLSGPAPRLGARVGLSGAATRAIDAILERALAVDPDARYASADALGADARAATGLLTAATPRRRWWRRRAPLVGAAVAVAIGAAGAVAAVRGGRIGSGLLGGVADPALVVVLPFADERGPTSAAALAGETPLDGRDAEQLLVDAMSRWTDLRLVNATRVNDALVRRGIAAPRTFDEAVAIARELGAGRLAWGTIARAPGAGATARAGAIAVRGALYDVAHPETTRREHTIHPGPALADLGREFGALADTLLLGTARSRVSVPGALGTTSLAAWRAYDRGHDLLARWDLDGAARAFGDAVALDPEYGLAHRWRAQAYAWMIDAPRAEWRQAAARAVALAGSMTPADGEASRALAALADGRYPEACRMYRGLVRRDSMDFAAWYGLGDCQAKDSLIVRDPGSPSGWRFRSSYRGAIEAYRRVLGSLPSVHLAFGGRAVTYLPRLLVTDAAQWRAGHAIDGVDTVRLAAFPALNADTLAFTPYLLADHAAMRPATAPATRAAALDRDRRILLDVAEGWVAAFPRSVDAAELRAHALESLGRVESTGPGLLGALDVVRAARVVAAAGVQRDRLAMSELRLLVKADQPDAARRFADSLLAATPQPAPADAARLAIAAALIGRVTTAAGLLRIAARDDIAVPPDEIPVPIGAERTALAGGVAYASLGAPRESVVVARARARALIAGADGAGISEFRRAYARDLEMLTFPDLGTAAPVTPRGQRDDDYLIALQRMAARGDQRQLRDRMHALLVRRRTMLGRVVSIDVTFQEAWLAAFAGDTAAALQTLGAALDTLPAQSARLLADVPRAAAVGRAMAFRARLAAARGDVADARRWSASIEELWRGADRSVLRANAVRFVAVRATP